MPIDIKVPPLPESVADATVLDWYHQVGEHVGRDEKLVDLETDKVVLEVVAPRDGVLTEIRKASGDTVNSNEVLALIDTDSPPPAESTTPEPKPEPRSEPRQVPPPPPESSTTPDTQAPAGDDNRPPPGPAARRLLEQHGLDVAQVPGTGPKGRITKGDVLAFIADEGDQPAPRRGNGAPAPDSTGPGSPDTPEPLPFQEDAPNSPGARPERRVPMTRLRRRIAERLIEAQQTAAMLTTFNEVDMTAIKALRGHYRDAFSKRHDVKLGFMSFFIKAVIQALRDFPLVNASVEGNDIIYHGYYDIGIAVSTPRGLVVPILRDADQHSFAGIEQAIVDVATRARDGKLSLDELTGGTFSITNGGIFGSLLSTPILNPPQSAILGMHKIQDRPMAVDGQVVIRPMMYLALSYDHRLVDGAEAVRFLVAVKQALEDPSRLLLEV